MFLKTLRLKNFLGFAEATLDLDLPGGDNRKWTVLAGENGTGKSSILHAIGLAMAGAAAVGELAPVPGRLVRVGAERALIEAEIETQKGRTRAIAVEIRLDDDPAALAERTRKSAAALERALGHSQRNYLTVGYGSQRRLTGGAERTTYRGSRARALAALFDPGVGLHPLEAWIASLARQEARAALDVAAGLVAEFLPELAFDGFDPETGALRVRTATGTVPMSSLGDGQLAVASLVGDLLYQITRIFADFADPLSARGLLLIDTLEVGLHPKLQRRLIDFLDRKLPHLQLVTTTNSLVIAQQCAPGVLHYCLFGPDGAEVRAYRGDPRKLLLNQVMMTEAFGESTDESLEVEQLKEEYVRLRGRDGDKARDRMAAIEDRLGHRPAPATEEALLNEAQRRLLAQMQQRLGGRDGTGGSGGADA